MEPVLIRTFSSAPCSAALHRITPTPTSESASAEPFSAAFGTYYRQVVEHRRDRRRDPFRLFSSHGEGSSLRENAERNVRAEELMSLGEGALLCGRACPSPLLIRRLEWGAL